MKLLPLLLLSGCKVLAGLGVIESREEPMVAAHQEALTVVNPGFEIPGDPVPQGWVWDLDRSGDKGQVTRDTNRAVSGEASLRLSPNPRNVAEDPLSVIQVIPAAGFQGQEVEFSGRVATSGDTDAILGMMVLVQGAPQGGPQMLFQPRGSGPEFVRHSGIFQIPDHPSAQLVLICMSNGSGGDSWFDDLSVVPVDSVRVADEPDTPSEPLSARITVDASTVLRDIPETLYGANVIWEWDGLGLWQAEEDRLDPTLVELTRDLGVTTLRYPGGYLSDFYHWRAGVGPRDRRPEVKHEPGTEEISRPNFGTDEVLDFGDQVGADLWITVNAGSGTAREAGDWVGYVNRDSTRVRYWEVGNELYLDLGSPITDSITVNPEVYARRFGEFASAMRAEDPDIRLAAIGGVDYGRYQFMGYPDWTEILLDRQGDQIDLLSIHNAYAPLITQENVAFRDVYAAMLAAPKLIGQNLDDVSALIEERVPEREAEIRIAVTEWGPAYRFALDSRWVDHVKTLGSALFSASVLKELIEAPRVDFAHFQQLNDFSVYGAIGSRNTDFPPNHDWYPTPRYYAFQLFTRHFGSRLVQSTVDGPSYDSPAVGFASGVEDAPYLDVVSSLSADGRRLYVIGINKHFDRAIDARIEIAGFSPAPDGTVWELNGSGLDAHTGTGIIDLPWMDIPRQAEAPVNPQFQSGGTITFGSSPLRVTDGDFVYRFPAHSATSIVLERRR